jgi:hypothetical protein
MNVTTLMRKRAKKAIEEQEAFDARIAKQPTVTPAVILGKELTIDSTHRAIRVSLPSTLGATRFANNVLPNSSQIRDSCQAEENATNRAAVRILQNCHRLAQIAIQTATPLVGTPSVFDLREVNALGPSDKVAKYRFYARAGHKCKVRIEPDGDLATAEHLFVPGLQEGYGGPRGTIYDGVLPKTGTCRIWVERRSASQTASRSSLVARVLSANRSKITDLCLTLLPGYLSFQYSSVQKSTFLHTSDNTRGISRLEPIQNSQAKRLSLLASHI